MKVFAGNGLSAFCLATALAAMASAGLGEGIEGITRPSEDITLSFTRSGQIREVLVKEGDQVKAGQVLVQQDDAAEQAQLEQLKAQAEDMIRIKAAEAQTEQKKVDLKKLQQAAERGAATELEVEHARLDVTIAELSTELAKFERDQARGKYKETKLLVDRMRLESPIAGKVEQVNVERGESIDALKEVVRVVKIDPLWIEMPAPRGVADVLSCGQTARVEFPPAPLSPGEKRYAEGKVTYIAAVADSASETRTVRVEVPNRFSRPAGDRVMVFFPQPPGHSGDPKAVSPNKNQDKKE